MQHFPFLACKNKGSSTVVSKVSEISANWTPDAKSKWQQGRGVWPWGIKFISHILHFSFPASPEKDTPKGTPKVNESMGCVTLVESRPWSIQIGTFGVHKTHLFKNYFDIFDEPHAAFPFSCIHWKGPPELAPKVNESKGVCDPGSFILKHLKSTKPIFRK